MNEKTGFGRYTGTFLMWSVLLSFTLLSACGDSSEIGQLPLDQQGQGPMQEVSGTPMVTISAGENETTLNWDPIPGAQSYQIYWDNEPWVDLTRSPILEPSTAFVHSGLQAGQHYYYVVSAKRQGKGENPSREVGAKPTLPAPFTPTGVSATPDDGQVTLDWRTFQGASGYRLYWSTLPGVTPATGARIDVPSPPFVHTGIGNGTTYYYVHCHVNRADIRRGSRVVSQDANHLL